MYFWFKSCVRYMCCEYFPSWYLFIHFLKDILWWAEMFNFNNVQFINFFSLWSVLFVWWPRNLCLLWGHKDILQCLLEYLWLWSLHLSLWPSWNEFFVYGDMCPSSFFPPKRLCLHTIFSRSLGNSYILNIINGHLSVQVSHTRPHQANFILHGIQYSSRTGHLNTEKYCKDRSQQLKTALHKYFILTFF